MRRHLRLFIALLIIGLLTPTYPSPQAQSFKCPDGKMSRPATAAEAAADGSGAGIIAGVTQFCPQSAAQLGISADSGRAKEYLKTKLAGAAASRGEVSVTKMMGPFACRLADFMRASETSGHDIRIFSGWRDETAQQNAVNNSRPGYACTGGANCPHPQGRAADLAFGGAVPKTTAACNASPGCRWAHANAARYQLAFPLTGNPLEPWHIEPVERSGLPREGPCGGDGGNPGGTYSGAPFGAGDQLRSALGMQPMMMQPMMPMQPLQQQQSPLGAFNPTPAQPTMQPISGSIGTPLPTTTRSVADQLMDIINGTTTVSYSTTTATTAPIVINKSNTGTIVSVTYSSSSQQYGSGSLQPVGQNTFGAPNMPPPANTPANTQRLIQLYTALRDVLVRILEIVRPFGGSRNATQSVPVDQMDEHVDLY